MSSEEETTPQYVRRLGKEYADRYHGGWSTNGRKWLKYAFSRGYQQACLDQAEEVESILAALDAWEVGGDDEALVNHNIDPWIAKIKARVEGVKP